ncbi:FIG00933687: hypothetical protein, partial [hydrothermal vent metagenome]
NQTDPPCHIRPPYGQTLTVFLYFSIFTISVAILGYEILLMRLFSIAQWSHFAYMVISLALLGFGASGTFIAIARKWILPRFGSAYILNAALFSFAMIGCYAVAQRIPFNPLEIAWDKIQWLYLCQMYLVLSVPFFFAANCIGLALANFGERIGEIYRADLLGAGSGALGITLCLFYFSPSASLKLLGGLGFIAAGLVAFDKGLFHSRWLAVGLIIFGSVASALIPNAWVNPRISQYKSLSQYMQVPGTKIVEERYSPLGLLTVVESAVIPFRYAPGLSLNNVTEPPSQIAIFTDADSISVITKSGADMSELSFLDSMTSALPYHIIKDPDTLVLGAGGGMDVLQALYHNAKSVDAVELNPQVVSLVKDTFSDFAGNIYNRNNVQVHIAEARGFVAASLKKYDLILLSLIDSFAASSAGVHAMNESYIYTTEAFTEYIKGLNPEGVLAVTRWLKLPPRDTLKLFATAVAALEERGIKDPGSMLALIRSPNTTTLLLKNGAFTEKENNAIRNFCESRSFDTAYYPGMQKEEANRLNVLRKPYFFEGASAILGKDRKSFFRNYKFDIKPATDDRPHFFNFFKWSSAPEFFSLIKRGGAPLVEWGYLILVLTLIQALFISVVLIVLPLKALKTRAKPRRDKSRVIVYFTSLGLAFMFVEIAFIQKFILFLSHPIYAVAVVLSSFLIFAGLGSGFSARMADRYSGHNSLFLRLTPVEIAVGFIIVVALTHLVSLPYLFNWFSYFPDTVKIIASVLLLSPLAFFMGMPFPLGLSRVAEMTPELVPWAWGVNGCASVISAALATLLAVHFGFSVVVTIAMILYSVAAFSMRKAFVR